MIMATKALLDRNPNPNIEEIKNALELAVVRSTEHHAKIQSINTSEAKQCPGFLGSWLSTTFKTQIAL